jgi:hypothetical protein
MKYSILIPYINRAKEFRMALSTYAIRYSDNRDDFEFVIVEDGKNWCNPTLTQELTDIIDEYPMLNIVRCPGISSMNPSCHFNQATKIARGKYLIVTNPETMATSDVFGLLDNEPAIDTSYILASCMNVEDVVIKNGMATWKFLEWYQHSVFKNTRLHFFSVISKELYEQVGGFDEEYTKGIGFEDNDFANNLILNNIPFVYRDDISTAHIMHDKSYQIARKKSPTVSVTILEKNIDTYAVTTETIIGDPMERNRQFYTNKWKNFSEKVDYKG